MSQVSERISRVCVCVYVCVRVCVCVCVCVYERKQNGQVRIISSTLIAFLIATRTCCIPILFHFSHSLSPQPPPFLTPPKPGGAHALFPSRPPLCLSRMKAFAY